MTAKPKFKRREGDRIPVRANEPGRFKCPRCGETLSGPAREYTCPRVSLVEKQGRAG